MGLAFRVLWRALKDFYEEMFTLVGANLVWVLVLSAALGIPYGLDYLGVHPAVTSVAGVLLLLVLLPPATAGMWYLTNQVAHHKTVEFRMMWDGARMYATKSWLHALLNIAVAALVYVNISFYGAIDAQWAVIVRGLFIGLAVLWVLIQIYVMPMLMEQQEPKFFLALRNAAFMTFASPIVTLLVGVLMVAIAALSIGLALPFAVAMMALLGLMSNGAVLALLVEFKIRKPPEELAPGVD
ncbi:MAG: hypothetical protein ACUVX9_16965 [Anaerolineae bacterium]